MMTIVAEGTFDVKLTPLAPDDRPECAMLGSMSIEKQFHGHLEATSKGRMLTAGTDVKGSAGYVAIERLSGKLHGREGSFVLQHSGTLARGVPYQNITVVPDSGIGEIVGLAGTMLIIIADGKHSYRFDYTLPESA
jgi:hypothetical protein